MKVEIKCTGTEYENFKKLEDLQGDLKTITGGNLEKLKNSIIKNGFSAPIFIWQSGKKKYLIDGHQRLKALKSLFAEGYEIPDIPIVYIEAKNKKEAKQKLLYISSQYGEFTVDGYADFTFDIDIDFDKLRLADEELLLKPSDVLFDENATNSGSGGNRPVESMTFWLYDYKITTRKKEIYAFITENMERIKEINQDEACGAIAKAIDEILR